MDLRVQKTYAALFQAMQELLAEKNFETITVRELCDRAMIRTATFYKHFSDKYEFFDFMVSQIHQEFHRDFVVSDTELTPRNYLIAMAKNAFHYMKTNRKVIQQLNADSFLTDMVHSVSTDMTNNIQKQFSTARQEGFLFPASDAIMTQIFIGSLFQCGRHYITQPHQTDIDQLEKEFLQWISSLFHQKES